MGFRFRKSIRVSRGVRINLTGRGVSSVSIGRPGATLNFGRTGVRTTVGIPGTGLSYSSRSKGGGGLGLVLGLIILIFGGLNSGVMHRSTSPTVDNSIGTSPNSEIASSAGHEIPLPTSTNVTLEGAPKEITTTQNLQKDSNGGAISLSILSTGGEQTQGGGTTEIVGAPLQLGPPESIDLETIPASSLATNNSATRALMKTSDSSAALAIQERLQALGFFAGHPDGKWGPQSRAALRKFRQSKKLGEDDRWDVKTQEALLSDLGLATAGGSASRYSARQTPLDSVAPTNLPSEPPHFHQGR
jgi:uncharacterized protein DUF4236/putative peptidoglycan binding protein